MKTPAYFLLVTLQTVLFAFPVFSEETAGGAEKTAPLRLGLAAHTSIAAGEILLGNAALFFGMSLIEADFVNISGDTLRNNLNPSTWRWEAWDRFHVNQAGHPYQGAVYFAAGRANHFNFYQSALFGFFGSYTWEIFFESAKPSLNDMVTTTMGGVFLGEALHRLYLEANRPNAFAVAGSTLLSPSDRLQDVLVNRSPSRSRGAVQEVSVSTAFGSTNAAFYNGASLKDHWDAPNGGMAAYVVYGDPFEQWSSVPFEHFELGINFAGVIPRGYTAAIIADGYLVSFAPRGHERSQASAGLSLHFDYFNTSNSLKDNTGFSNLNISANSLDWTWKWRYLFSPSLAAELKAHAGWLAWGNGNYNTTEEDGTYNDYATGVNAKMFFSLAHKQWGRLDLAAIFYLMRSIAPFSSYAEGWTRFYYADCSYSYPLTPVFSIGVRDTFLLVKSNYDRAPGLNRRLNSADVFVRWTW